MKLKIGIGAALLLAGIAVVLPQVTQPARPLASMIPSSPMLYIEARDFASLVKQWNASNEKKLWLGSSNYQVFSRSRLFLRFADAQTEFAAAAGLTPDMTLVDAAAGGNSALALYDIGNLEFLYVTRMPSARAFQTALWQSRAKFQPRKSAGIDYYVRQEQRRLAAFAVTNDLLLIATEEQAMASALALIAGEQRPAMIQESWHQRAVAAQPTQGEFRLAMNFERVRQTPYFRSYWVQRNARDLMQFNSFISDLDRTGTEYRERRTLLRAEAGVDVRPAEAALAELSRYALADAGLVRTWAKPDAATTLALVTPLMSPRLENAGEIRTAPVAGNIDSTTGSEEDLETRIDEAPLADDSANADWQSLRALFEGNSIQAMLQVERSQTAPDGVFASTPGAIAILGERPWDGAAARAAVESAVSKIWTVGGLGTGWTQRQAYWTMSGLGKVTVATAGRVLIIANAEDLLSAMLGANTTQPVVPNAAYAMRFLNARELPRYQRMMTLIDYPTLRNAGAGDAREPLFFSENIASLSRTLGRVDSVQLESHDEGAAVKQTIVYKLQ